MSTKLDLFHYKTTCFITKKCLVIKHFYQAHLNTCSSATSNKSHIISHIPLVIGNIPHRSTCLEIIFAKQLQSLRLFSNRYIKKRKKILKKRNNSQRVATMFYDEFIASYPQNSLFDCRPNPHFCHGSRVSALRNSGCLVRVRGDQTRIKCARGEARAFGPPGPQ